MKFSVIIPTYNRLDFLKQAIGSVLAQTYTDYEIIIVDDGSTDGTKDYLLSLASHVKVLRQANRGPGAARNLGAERAAGRYLAFLDSDDSFYPWTLATFHEAICRYHDPSFVSAATLEFQGQVPDVEKYEFVAERFKDYFETANDPAYVGSGALVVKRTIFDQASGFDEAMPVGEDLDFYFRVGTSCEFVRVLAPVTLAYRRHARNISATSSALYSAAVELLMREAAGRYPGGKARKIERWKLLTRMVRPVILSCLKAGLVNEAWRLYWQSFLVNARLGRLRFLSGFAFYGVLGLVLGRRGDKFV
jgi:glycosyltransferase involved in cell wall biosynthesis